MTDQVKLVCLRFGDEEPEWVDEVCEDCGYCVDHAGSRRCTRCDRIRLLEAKVSEMHAHSDGCSLGHPDGDCSDDPCYVAGLHARIAELEGRLEVMKGGQEVSRDIDRLLRARIRELEDLLDELACATDGCVESTPEGRHFHTASGRIIDREET